MKAIISEGTGKKDGRITAYISETKIVAYMQEMKTVRVVDLNRIDNAILREDDASTMKVSEFVDYVLKYKKIFNEK